MLHESRERMKRAFRYVNYVVQLIIILCVIVLFFKVDDAHQRVGFLEEILYSANLVLQGSTED